jgi:hypothetical protein
MYKILSESQVKEKPITYTKWEKCLLFVDFVSDFFNFDILFWNYLSFYWILCYQSFTCRGRENKSPHNFREIRKQIIWGNKYIKYKGKCLVKVNWIKSGIIFIILLWYKFPVSLLFSNNLNIHVICKAFILVSMLVIFNPPSK